MNRSISLPLGMLASVLTLSGLLLTAGARHAYAGSGCTVFNAAGHTWTVVAIGVPCPTAAQVVRGFAAQSAALRRGSRATVTSPLAGFRCTLANEGRPGGSCSTAAGAPKIIIWVAS